MSRILISIVLALTLVLCTACESKVTTANFEKITIGMDKTQVENILGSGTDDTPLAGYGAGGSGGTVLTSKAADEQTFVWKGKGFKIIVKYKNGKVVEKSKV